MRFLSGPDQLARRPFGDRQLRTAFEIGAAPPGLRQHRRRRLDVARLAVVGGAGERQFGIAEAVAVGGTALDERQSLQRLHRRAREYGLLDIADSGAAAAGRIDHDDGTAMPALDDRAAGDFDQDRVGRQKLTRPGGSCGAHREPR